MNSQKLHFKCLQISKASAWLLYKIVLDVHSVQYLQQYIICHSVIYFAVVRKNLISDIRIIQVCPNSKYYFFSKQWFIHICLSFLFFSILSFDSLIRKCSGNHFLPYLLTFRLSSLGMWLSFYPLGTVVFL